MYINVIRATIISPFKAAIIKISCRNYMGASSVSTTEKWEFSLSLWIFWLLVQTRNIRGKETGKCSLSIWTSKNFENPHVKALKNMYLCDRSCTYNSPSVSVPLKENFHFEMYAGDILIQLFQIYYWSVTTIFLGDQKYWTEKLIWSDDGSLTFTISFLNNSWICWSIIRLPPDSYLIEEDLTPDAVSHSQYLEWLCCFLSLTSFQKKSLAALVLGLCANLLEKSHFYYWMYIYGNLWTENLYSFFRRLV